MTQTTNDLAQSLLEEGDFNGVLAIYKNQDSNQNPHLLHIAAIAHAQLDQLQDALSLIETAVTLDSENPKIYNSYGNMLSRANDFDHAAKAFQTALQLQPSYAAAHNNLGNLYLATEQLELAKAEYEAAIEIKPNFSDAYFNLGRAHILGHNYKEAEKQLLYAAEHDSSHYRALTQLGQLYLQHSKWEDAELAFEKSLSVNNQQASVYAALCTIALQAEQFDQAIEYGEKADAFNTHLLNNHWHLATAYLATGNTQKALKHYLREVQLEPNVDCFFNIGVLKSYENENDEAVKYLQEALKRDNDYLPAHLNLASIFLKQQKIDQAILHYEKAHALKPQSAEIEHVLHALKQDKNPRKAPQEFITHLFDQYSPHYDQHLIENLKFSVPKLITEAFKTHTNNKAITQLLDLGCGTGLSTTHLKPHVQKMIGIDLSPKMLAVAKTKNQYEELSVMDVEKALSHYLNNDAIIAGDVFTYLGDLSAVISLAYKNLTTGGIFIFTVEKGLNANFHLSKSVRYQHHEDYLRNLIKQSAFTELELSPCQLRHQFGKAVPGFLVVLKK